MSSTDTSLKDKYKTSYKSNKEIENLDNTYKLCLQTGNIREKFVDVELIKSLKYVAIKGLEFINKKTTDIEKNSSDWTFVFRDYYESLRGLIEAYILFDGIKADNHQCKNAYLCHQHPEHYPDWEFLETIRLKRNAINYRGILLNYEEWKMLELKFELHINLLKKEIENKIKKIDSL